MSDTEGFLEDKIIFILTGMLLEMLTTMSNCGYDPGKSQKKFVQEKENQIHPGLAIKHSTLSSPTTLPFKSFPSSKIMAIAQGNHSAYRWIQEYLSAGIFGHCLIRSLLKNLHICKIPSLILLLSCFLSSENQRIKIKTNNFYMEER